MLKCAGNDDIITMKADDNGDVVTFMFENKGAAAAAAARRAAGPPDGADDGAFGWGSFVQSKTRSATLS
jgi:hypothetical protein